MVKCVQPAPDDFVSQLLRVVLGPENDPIRVAVIAGIESYPLIDDDKAGDVVKQDIDLLKDLFADTLGYDLIVTVQNEGVATDTLDRLFGVELPQLLAGNPGSQVVFAYSGHGAQYGKESYLLTVQSTDLTLDSASELDVTISLSELKRIVAPTVRSSFQFLLLLNSCYGGSLLREQFSFGDPIFSSASAQGVTAGREQDLVYGLDTGRGSVLFEYFAEILTSAAAPGATPMNDLGPGAMRAGRDGIVTLSEIAFLLKPAVEQLENYRVSPQIGNLTIASPQESNATLYRKEGDFFFITNEEAADKALERSRNTSYRKVMASMGADLGPLPTSTLIRNEFSPESAVEVSTQYDWRLARVETMEGNTVCYVESTGVTSLNDMLDILRPRMPFAGGKFSKLRFVPPQVGLSEDDTGFWYVFTDDLPLMSPSVNQLNFTFFVQLATWDLQVDVRYPYSLRSEGVGLALAGSGDSAEQSALSGSFVTITGYQDLEPLPLTPRVAALKASTRRFVHARLLPVLRITEILGGSDLLASKPTYLAELIRYDDLDEALVDAGEGQVSMTDWLGSVRTVNADYQALPQTEKNLLDALAPEDWAVFMSAVGFRNEVFSDSVSFMGFTAILRDFDANC